MSLDISLYDGEECVFSENITNNLTVMADAAGLYEAVWHPERLGITEAGQLIQHLLIGADELIRNDKKYKKLEAKNGWGTYNHFFKFLCEYIAACHKYPHATISVFS